MGGDGFSSCIIRVFTPRFYVFIPQTELYQTGLLKKKTMNKQEDDNREQTDEIGAEVETGAEVNAAIEQLGEDAAEGIPRDTDAARQEQKREEATG